MTTNQSGQLEQLHERLVDGVRAIRSGDDWRAWLAAASRFHQYSFGNVMLIYLQRPNATKVAGYTTWKKLGRQVNKGERGIQILAPVLARTTKDGDARDADATSDTSDTSAEKPPRRMIGVRRTYVWDILQTFGPPLPEPPRPVQLDGVAPDGLWDALAQQVADAGFTLEREAIPAGAERGYSSYADHRVVIAERLGPADAVATLAHEVAHMLMHNQVDFPETTRGCRGVREVEAESVAYIVTANHGLATDRISFPYVATWASTADSSEPECVVQETGQRVIAVASRLVQASTPDTESADTSLRDRAIRRSAPAVAASRDLVIPPPDLEQGEPPCI